MKKTLLSVLMMLAMIVSMIPAMTVPVAAATEKLDTPAIQLNDKTVIWRPVDNAQRYEVTLLFRLEGAGEAVSVRVHTDVDLVGTVTKAAAYLGNSSSPTDVTSRIQYLASLKEYILNLNELISYYHSADYRCEIRATADGYASSDTVSTDKITGKDLVNGYSTPFTLAGKVILDSDSEKLTIGSKVNAVCTGSTFDEVSSSELQYAWMYRDGESGTAYIIPGASGNNYTIANQYDNKQISVAVSSTKRSGIVYSKWITVGESSIVEKYTVTVVDDGKGIGSASPASGPDGTVVTLTATPNPGYKFKEWVRTAGKLSGGLEVPNSASATTSFTISGYDVEVMATFEEDASSQPVDAKNHTVTVIDDGKGTGSASPTYAPDGTVVTLTATPNPGYKFKEWVRTAGMLSGGLEVPNSASATTTFTISGYNVEVMATFEENTSDISNPFSDVYESDNYYDAVLWAYYASPQVTNGMDETHFGPQLTVTRGQAVTFLWRSQGCPEPSNTNNPFKDVPSSEYFYKPILWAVEQGITKGVDETHFNPMDTLSTQHMVTFMYRTKNPGHDGWSGSAAAWADDGNGRPFGVAIAVNNTTPCPRCNVVQFLYKLSK